MKIGRGMKSLVESGKWKIGWISPKNVLYVSRKDEHERFIQDILGSRLDKDWFDEWFDSGEVYHSGWVRLLNGTMIKDFDPGVLGITVSNKYYTYVLSDIKNTVPFYRYFDTLYIDIYYPNSTKVRSKIERLQYYVGEKEKPEFSLLNPYRGRYGRIF